MDYRLLATKDQLRVNAVILRAFETGEPKGFIGAFQAGLNTASTVTITQASSKVNTNDGITRREVKFQNMLDGLRDTLSAHLDELPALGPIGSTDGKSERSAQTATLRSIKKQMAESSRDATDEQVMAHVKTAIATDKPIVAKTLGEKAKEVLVQYTTKQSIGKIAALDGREACEVSAPLGAGTPSERCRA